MQNDTATDGWAHGGSTTILVARRAWLHGAFRPAQVHLAGGIVTAIVDAAEPVPAGIEVVAIADDEVLLPGFVDSHVHINEPGRTQWEGFATATRAAAAAGVTTLVDMPLNSIPPTTTREHLATKRAAAQGQLSVDLAFWGGAVPENLGELAGLHEAGVRGFKAFTAPSGVPEFGHLDPAQLDRALAATARLGTVLVVHAEDPRHLADAPGGRLGTQYGDFLASRPPVAEESAIGRLLDGVWRTGAAAHVLHLSDAGALPLLRQAKSEGLPVTVETCPHYLALRSEDVPDGATQFKCCPPIREGANADALWEAVLDGTIDAIVSDHSPATAQVKSVEGGDFGLSWGGIASLQVAIAVAWTRARTRGIALERLLPAVTTGPARIAGLDAGVIAVGRPAHLVAFAPEQEFTVDATALEHRNPVSPYDGARLAGMARTVWLHGSVIARDGAVTAESTGREILTGGGR